LVIISAMAMQVPRPLSDEDGPRARLIVPEAVQAPESPAAELDPASDLTASLAGQTFGTILADPPWRFVNRTGKVAPEHKRLSRYETMTLGEIKALPVADFAADKSHLYLWTPNALVADGIPFTDGELAFVAASLFLPSIAP
jgi:hypothetical protein